MILRELKIILICILCMVLPWFISIFIDPNLHGLLYFWGGMTYADYLKKVYSNEK